MYRKFKKLFCWARSRKKISASSSKSSHMDDIELGETMLREPSFESSNTSCNSIRLISTPNPCQFKTIADVHIPGEIFCHIKDINDECSNLSAKDAIHEEGANKDPSNEINNHRQPSETHLYTPLLKNLETDLLEQITKLATQFPDMKTDIRILWSKETVVYLLGTNHADPQCPLDVANVVRAVKPSIALIELCAWRVCGCRKHRGNVFQRKPEFTFRYLRRIISQIGFLPAMIFFTDAFNEKLAVDPSLLDYGSEFAVAAQLCGELADCRVMLGDREIPITVKRQAAAMSNWRGIRISAMVTLSLMCKRYMKRLLFRCHQLVMQDPKFYQVVVMERDIYLTHMIQIAAELSRATENPYIVAVVGQGHLKGIETFWGKVVPSVLPFILSPECCL